ncbi:hypothetical protein FRB97_005374, partial [Tulasnella sp. 331]
MPRAATSSSKAASIAINSSDGTTEAALIGKMAQYTTSLTWTLEDFDVKGLLSKDWKPFLKDADKKVLEIRNVTYQHSGSRRQVLVQYVQHREVLKNIPKMHIMASRRAKVDDKDAAVEARLVRLALKTAKEHHAATSDQPEPTPAVLLPASTVATHQSVDWPVPLPPPSAGMLDGRNPDDFLGRTLAYYKEDEPPRRYTVRCHAFGQKNDWFILRCGDGFDDWELTLEEMRLKLKKSAFA